MSEQATEASATAAEGTDTPAPEQEQQPKETETVDFWKQKAREQEKRAKANASAQAKLDEIEQANLSEIEKISGRAKTAETERDQARAEALRLRVAAKHGIGEEDADLFLTGMDEETLTRQAERLSKRTADAEAARAAQEAEARKRGNHVPAEGPFNGPAATPESDERTFVRSLFSGDT